MNEPWNGGTRPPQIPDTWRGRPLRGGDGWCWEDPENAGNSVRFYRGDPASVFPSKRSPYVVVCSEGFLIDRDGEPIPDSSCPED